MPARLDPKLRELVAVDRLGRPRVGSLTAAQAEALTPVALGEQVLDEPVSATRAITALGAGLPDAAMPVLAAVLGDPEAPHPNRIAAARALGVIATPEAEALLLDAARDPDPPIQRAVLAALGWFGGPTVTRELRTLQAADAGARRQLQFTFALVAHRHGLDGPFLEPVAAGTTTPAAAAGVTMTGGRAADDLPKLRGPMFGMPVAARAYALRCTRNEWTIFVNEQLGKPQAQTRLIERAWIAAVVARWYSDGMNGSTRLVVLTRPAGDQARVDVVRGDGEIVYTGTAHPLGNATAFTVADSERRGAAPLRLAGRLTARGVQLDTALAATNRIGARTARPISS